MAKIMAHVDEVGLPGAHSFRSQESFRNCEVGRMGIMAKGVNDQGVYPLGSLDGLFREALAVREISKASFPVFLKNKPVRHHAAMRQVYRGEAPTSEFKGARYLPGIRADIVWVTRRTIESIFKNTLQILECCCRAVDWDRFVLEFTEATQIVEAERVINM
jgi:hypothetical protein